jgi:hypothetical protein
MGGRAAEGGEPQAQEENRQFPLDSGLLAHSLHGWPLLCGSLASFKWLSYILKVNDDPAEVFPMTTVMPQSELMRKAITWVSQERAEKGTSLGKLIDQAGMRFNLGPKEQEFLREFFAKEENQS